MRTNVSCRVGLAPRWILGTGISVIAVATGFAATGCSDVPVALGGVSGDAGESAAESTLTVPAARVTAERLASSGVSLGSVMDTPVLDKTGRNLAFLESGSSLPYPSDGNTDGTDLYVRDRSARTFGVFPLPLAAGYRRYSRIGPQGMDGLGRFVTITSATGTSFESWAYRKMGIYLWDRTAGSVRTIEELSVNYDYPPQSSISSSGNLVAYVDANSQLALYGVTTGQKTLLRNAAGQPINLYYRTRPALSASGRLVYFTTFADYVDSTLPHTPNVIFVADTSLGTIAPLRLNIPGNPFITGDSLTVSDDGNKLAFYNVAFDLGDGVSSNLGHIYYYDRTKNSCTRLSAETVNGIIQPGTAANNWSSYPMISSDGRRVAFTSMATNLVSPTSTTQDAYVADLTTLELRRVSITSTGNLPNNHTASVGISGDGNTVCMSTDATNILPSSPSNRSVYCRTLQEGAPFNGHRYRVYPELSTWASASSKCRALGAHLVTLSSQAESNFVVSITPPAADIRLWIGVTDAGTEGTWRWIDGSSMSYSNWAPGEPNNSGGAENWAAMYTSSTAWVDLPAAWTASYACEWDS